MLNTTSIAYRTQKTAGALLHVTSAQTIWRPPTSAVVVPHPIYEYDSKAQILCHAPPLQPRIGVTDFPLALYRCLLKKISKEDTLWNPAETLEVDRFHTFCTFGAVLTCSWIPLDPGWTKTSTKHKA